MKRHNTQTTRSCLPPRALLLALGLTMIAAAADPPENRSSQPAYRPKQDVVLQGDALRLIDGQAYHLFWGDNFDGTTLSSEHWRPRFHGGPAFNAQRRILRTADETYLDGEGNLVIAMRALTREDALAYAASDAMRTELAGVADGELISTTNSLAATQTFCYGYFEVRWKPSPVAGPGFCVWFPYRYDGTDRTTEIDVFEGTMYARGRKADYKSSTIHFYPGGWKDRDELKQIHNYLSFQRTRPGEFDEEDVQALVGDVILNRRDFRYDPNNPTVIDNSADGQTRVVYYHNYDDRFLWDDGDYHTVALLWTPESYTFFYDHECIGSFDKGISHSPQQLILSLRHMGGDMWLDPDVGFATHEGRADLHQTPAKTLVDYVRVYKLSEDIARLKAAAAAGAPAPEQADPADAAARIQASIVQRLARATVRLPTEDEAIGKAEIEVAFDAAPTGWPQVLIPLPADSPRGFRGVSATVTYLAEGTTNLALSMAVPTLQQAGVAGASRYVYLVPGKPTRCTLDFAAQPAAAGGIQVRLALKTPEQAHRLLIEDLAIVPVE